MLDVLRTDPINPTPLISRIFPARNAFRHLFNNSLMVLVSFASLLSFFACRAGIHNREAYEEDVDQYRRSAAIDATNNKAIEKALRLELGEAEEIWQSLVKSKGRETQPYWNLLIVYSHAGETQMMNQVACDLAANENISIDSITKFTHEVFLKRWTAPTLRIHECLIEKNRNVLDSGEFLASYFFAEQEYGEAILYSNIILAKRPNDFNSLYRLGVIRELSGDKVKAIQYYREALQTHKKPETDKKTETEKKPETERSEARNPEKGKSSEAEKKSELERKTEVELRLAQCYFAERRYVESMEIIQGSKSRKKNVKFVELEGKILLLQNPWVNLDSLTTELSNSDRFRVNQVWYGDTERDTNTEVEFIEGF